MEHTQVHSLIGKILVSKTKVLGSSPGGPAKLNVACAPFRVLRVNLRSVYRYNTVTGEALGILFQKNFAKHLRSSENRNI